MATNNRFMKGEELLNKLSNSVRGIRLGKKTGPYKTLSIGETWDKYMKR